MSWPPGAGPARGFDLNSIEFATNEVGQGARERLEWLRPKVNSKCTGIDRADARLGSCALRRPLGEPSPPAQSNRPEPWGASPSTLGPVVNSNPHGAGAPDVVQ